MSEIENELEAAAKGFAAVKAGLIATRKSLSKIMDMDTAAGNLEAANAAMRVRGLIERTQGEVDIIHADATVEMRRYFPEQSDDIQTRGGGGGR